MRHEMVWKVWLIAAAIATGSLGIAATTKAADEAAGACFCPQFNLFQDGEYCVYWCLDCSTDDEFPWYFDCDTSTVECPGCAGCLTASRRLSGADDGAKPKQVKLAEGRKKGEAPKPKDPLAEVWANSVIVSFPGKNDKTVYAEVFFTFVKRGSRKVADKNREFPSRLFATGHELAAGAVKASEVDYAVKAAGVTRMAPNVFRVKCGDTQATIITLD